MKSKQPSRRAIPKSTRALKLALPIPRRRIPWHESAVTMIGESAAPALRIGQANAAMNGVPVILIEDNRLLLEGLSAVLSAQGLKVIATAASGSGALRQIARLRPHLVLLDATLGDRNSLGMVRALKKVFPDMKVVVMHLLPAQEDVLEFVRAGVSGFIMKDASLADFVSTIRTVADGGSVLPPVVTGTLFSHVAEQAVAGTPGLLKTAMRMTARERAVANLIADGNGNGEIASELGLTANSVRSHVHNILEKFALHMRLDTAADARARRELAKGFNGRRSGPGRVASAPGEDGTPKRMGQSSTDEA
jgi:two-component system, NarL family, response regulator DegU